VYDLTERVPIRLAKENGERIDLDVHTMDLKVHRSFSAFPIPFTGGFNAGIDLNQASIEIELQGVFVDEPGQEESISATAKIEFGGDKPPFREPGQGEEGPNPPAVTHPPSTPSNSRLNGIAIGFANNSRPVIPTFPPSTPNDAEEKYRQRFMLQMHNREMHIPAAYQVANGPAVPPNGDYVRFIFDSKRSGSVKEPFAYPRLLFRNTDLTTASSSAISANSDGTLTISITSGDPRTWFETPDDLTEAFSVGIDDTTRLGQVQSVTSNTITFSPFAGITTSTNVNNKTIQINLHGIFYNRVTDPPIMVIPIKHMFDKTPPNFADGSARSVGTATSPGEILAYIVAQAIQSDAASTVGRITDRDLVLGSGDLSDVFSVDLVAGRYSDLLTTLIITQKFTLNLGSQGEIRSDIPADISPVIHSFSGGKRGNKVKSAGDKVQDILGIVANSQNYQQNNNGTFVGAAFDFADKFTAIAESRDEDVTGTGDYIIGIQIPYETDVTFGLNLLDGAVSQRNFYTTFGDADSDEKTGIANTIHASLAFNPSARKHRTNGIKAVVTDFTAMHDAQERLYNFTMKLIAVDSLL
tara:strand:+ start:1201 stop:2949 length:1749 start_codon:yes stop_codon:yes gene_type:complete